MKWFFYHSIQLLTHKDKGDTLWQIQGRLNGLVMPKDLALSLTRMEHNIFFVHYSSIIRNGYRTLRSGQVVNYEIKEGEKGLHAEKVVPVFDRKKKSGNLFRKL